MDVAIRRHVRVGNRNVTNGPFSTMTLFQERGEKCILVSIMKTAFFITCYLALLTNLLSKKAKVAKDLQNHLNPLRAHLQSTSSYYFSP